jgi:acyl-CoA synthetase (NDP forming)
MGTIILNAILTDGYEGRIFPVHPKEKRVLNLERLSPGRDLPEVPDLAILSCRQNRCGNLEGLREKGIRRAIIVTAGFSEVGAKGPARQEEIKAIARQYNIRFTGPNCIGWSIPT